MPDWEARHLNLHTLLTAETIFSFSAVAILGQIVTSILPSVICAFLLNLLRPKKFLIYGILVLLPFVFFSIYSVIGLPTAVWGSRAILSFSFGTLVPIALILVLLFVFDRFLIIKKGG